MLREENVVSSKFIKLIEPPYVLHLTVLSVQKKNEGTSTKYVFTTGWRFRENFWQVDLGLYS